MGLNRGWTDEDVRSMAAMLAEGLPYWHIADRLQRTLTAIESKVRQLRRDNIIERGQPKARPVSTHRKDIRRKDGPPVFIDAQHPSMSALRKANYHHLCDLLEEAHRAGGGWLTARIPSDYRATSNPSYSASLSVFGSPAAACAG